MYLNNTPHKFFHILPTLPYLLRRTQICCLPIFLQLFFTPTSESAELKIILSHRRYLSKDEDSEEVSESELQNRLAQVWVPKVSHNLAKWWEVDKKETGFRVYSLWKLSGSYKSWELRTYNCGNSETNQVRGWMGFLVWQDTQVMRSWPWRIYHIQSQQVLMESKNNLESYIKTHSCAKHYCSSPSRGTSTHKSASLHSDITRTYNQK